MLAAELVGKIQALIEPVLTERRMELVELTCRPQGGQQHVCVLVDKVGSVTIQECAQVNQQIQQALEAANLIEGSYIVEVSSPGLDRPLITKRDFERAIGEQVRVEMRVDEVRTKEVQGMVLAVQPEAVVLTTPSGNVTVPLGAIRLAKKALRW